MSEGLLATRIQRRVLVYLSEYPRLKSTPSLGDVARYFNISKSRVRGILHALHRRGLLRRPSTDGLFCDHVLELEDTPDTNRALAKP